MEPTNYLVIIVVLTLVVFYLFYQLFVKRSLKKRLSEELSELSALVLEKQGEDKKVTEDLRVKNIELKHLIKLEKNEKELKASVLEFRTSLSQLNLDVQNGTTEKFDLSTELEMVKNEISIYQPVMDLVNVGFIEDPEYLFETSERFKEEIKETRRKQKELITDKKAVFIPDGIALTSNKSYTNKVLGGQSKLMLKAFNIECDNLMLAVKPSNYAKILERIDKLATDIEKTTVSLKCGFTKEYVELKFKECELQYQFKLKDAREKEEQAAIKEMMREEQKAIREFERALAKAQKEEKMYQEALESAQKELEHSNDADKDKLMSKIALLEKQLEEAKENEKRAQSMAELTRRGHVYVISNIGSFGEDVYKIGLTRRLEPLDRVKELGDASVPFKFDVHAMIFSEDAPALETSLHREFTQSRVNQVNHRKEFFNVSLLDIKDKVVELTGNDVDFNVTALAEDYYESLKMKNEELLIEAN